MVSNSSRSIGFIRHIAIGVPFWTIAEHGVRERARELDVRLLIRQCSHPAEQAQMIQALVQQQVGAIIVAPIDPNDPAFVAALNVAASAGIPIVAADQPLPYPAACLVRSDDLHGAAAGAAYLIERLGQAGKVIHLQGGMHTPVGQLRSQGVRQVLDACTGIQVVAETDQGDWQRVRTRSLMQELLAVHPDVCGVIAANDPMALGAIDALAAIGRTDCIVTGIDGDPDALLALEAGTLAATVRRSPYQLGRRVVEVAWALCQGQWVPSEILLDDMTLITGAIVARAALESLQIMPGMINDLMQSSVVLVEERTMLRTIIDSVPDVMYVKDREGRFEVANLALAQLLGLLSPDVLIGKTDFDFFPQKLAAQYHADEQSLMRSGTVLSNKEELTVDSEGRQRWLVTTKVPLRDAEGRVFRLVGHGQDITERKLAEAEQLRLQEDLIQAQQAALQELSTPLIPISDRVLVMPLIGRIDTQRAAQILETLLQGIQAQQADLAIIDITGVNVVDTQVAHALIQAARAVKLLGAQVMLTGLRPEIAQTLVSLGVDLSDIVTRSTLQSGIAYGLGKG